MSLVQPNFLDPLSIEESFEVLYKESPVAKVIKTTVNLSGLPLSKSSRSEFVLPHQPANKSLPVPDPANVTPRACIFKQMKLNTSVYSAAAPPAADTSLMLQAERSQTRETAGRSLCNSTEFGGDSTLSKSLMNDFIRTKEGHDEADGFSPAESLAEGVHLHHHHIAESVHMADDVQLADGVQLSDDVHLTEGVQLSDDVQLADDVHLTDDVHMADDVQLSDDVQLADDVHQSDGEHMADDVQLSDGVQLVDGEHIMSMPLNDTDNPSGTASVTADCLELDQDREDTRQVSEEGAACSDEQELSTDCLLTISTPLVPQAKVKAGKREDDIIIDSWIIRPLKNWICVEGHKKGTAKDQFWHSTCIAERLAKKRVATSSGSTYRLVGRMVQGLCQQLGFSEHFVRQFALGFPTNWKELIAVQLLRLKEGAVSDSPSVMHKPVLRQRASKSCTNIRTSSRTRKNRFSSPVSRNQSRHKNKDQNTELVLSDLPTTRSGRHVCPSLAWWVGQRLIVHPKSQTPDIKQASPNALLGINILKFKENKRAERLEKHLTARIKSTVTVTKQLTSDRDSEVEAPRRKLRTARGRHPVIIDTDSDIPQGHDLDTEVKVKEHKCEDGGEATNCEATADSGNATQTSEAVAEELEYSQLLSETLAKLDSTDHHTDRAQSLKKRMATKKTNDGSYVMDAEEDSERPDSSVEQSMALQVPKSLSLEDPVSDSTAESIYFQPDPKAGHHQPTDIAPNPPDKIDMKMLRKKSKKTKTAAYNRSPHIELENILNTDRHTPRLYLEKALANQTAAAGTRAKVDSGSRANKKAAAKTQTNEIVPVTGTRVTRKTAAGLQKNQNPQTENSGVGHQPRTRQKASQAEETEETESDKDSVIIHRKISRPRRGTNSCKNLQLASVPENDILGSSPVPAKTSKRHSGRSRKKECASRTRIAETVNQDLETDTETAWSSKETAFLHKVMKAAGSTSPDWKQVASSLPGHSADQCQQHYRAVSGEKQNKKPGRSSKTKKQTVKKVCEVTGGKGTLKRKRQIRELVQNHDEGYQDDLFDATPFKNVKKKRMQLDDDDDDDDFFTNFKTPAGNRFDTPRSRHLVLSEKKSSHFSGMITPSVLSNADRNRVDQHIKHLKKGKGTKRVEPTHPIQKQSQKKGRPCDLDVNPELFQSKQHSDHDSEEEDDYYFSDNDA